jgi:TRAP-type C4-dicarboxylate transport system substrate-binding protein
MNRLPAAMALALAVAVPAAAQTKRDMPTAYPASNFTPRTSRNSAADVDHATGGKLKITVHSNASLFKAPDRAVQADKPRRGKLLVNLKTKTRFTASMRAFPATSYGESMALPPNARGQTRNRE